MTTTSLVRWRAARSLLRGALALLLAGPLAAQVRYEDLLQGPGENWLTYAGGYSAQRHSPLREITRENVGSLVPKWTYHVDGARRLSKIGRAHV